MSGIHFGVGRGAKPRHRKEKEFVINCYGWILWNDIKEGNVTRDFAVEV
jgi:hypothetical protein